MPRLSGRHDLCLRFAQPSLELPSLCLDLLARLGREAEAEEAFLREVLRRAKTIPGVDVAAIGQHDEGGMRRQEARWDADH